MAAKLILVGQRAVAPCKYQPAHFLSVSLPPDRQCFTPLEAKDKNLLLTITNKKHYSVISILYESKHTALIINMAECFKQLMIFKIAKLTSPLKAKIQM